MTAAGTSQRARLEDLTRRFTDAFNRNDLDAVMAFFAKDAVYDEFNGAVSRGRDAIRAVFVPQFRGDFGIVRFEEHDVFADEGSTKALIRWTCVLERDGTRRGWRGLDVLEFDGDLIRHKSTYAKAAVPVLGSHDSVTHNSSLTNERIP